MMTIGAVIYSWRNARKLSRPALASMARISRFHLFAVEAGHYAPTLATVEKIADALEIGVARFFRGHDEARLLLDDPLVRETARMVKNLTRTQREPIVKPFAR